MGRRHAVLALVSICSIALAVPSGCEEGNDEPLYRVLVGGRMIDGTGAEPVEDVVLVISAGRIQTSVSGGHPPSVN